MSTAGTSGMSWLDSPRKYLDVNLSSENISEYEIPVEWSALHVGGRGIAARILLNELEGNECALSPENILIFATGPFQGSGLPGAGRHVVMALSPKTGSVADSYAGGYFGHELGRSGYDGIIVRGAASEPVILALIDGNSEFLAAEDLWGKGTGETESVLSKRYKNGRVASIGIAGENLVQMSCIISDRSRAAGRPGLGAVMGAKQLKAIVVRSSRRKEVYDVTRFEQERAEYAELLSDGSMDQFGKYGTSRLVVPFAELGILPTKNFQEGVFAGAESIGGGRMHDTILVGRETCAGCPIRCKRKVATSFRGRAVLPEFGGPEYETIAAFGSLCLNEDLDAIALANQLCNDYGIDTISAGVACAFVMEASEEKLVDEALPWGDASGIIAMIDNIARREAIGNRIADGLEAFAKELGADYCMTIKGVEIPMHEPRGKQGLSLSYATSPRGATHMEGMHDTMLEIDAAAPELGVNRAYDRFTLADKPRVAKLFEDLRSFENSLILCIFTSRFLGEQYRYPRIRSLLEAATGMGFSAKEMLRVGERNYTLLRLHAARAGYTSDQDGIPARFFHGLPQGASADHPIEPGTLHRAIEAYRESRGFDRLGPTDSKLRELDLEDCVGAIRR